MKTVVTAAVMLLMLELAPSAQLAFDAASIKENKSLDSALSLRLMPGGGVTGRHVPARNFINIAYGLKGYQVIGAPDWSRTTFYDIIATPARRSTPDQTFLMFQALLVNRFKLRFHRETREVDGYSLVQAKPGTFGPNLHPSTIDCDKLYDTTPRCKEGGTTSERGVTTMKSTGADLWGLLQVITAAVGAPVSDDTHLTGPFDFEFRYTTNVASTDVPSVFTAIQEQLGFKLERRRVSAEVLVVDRFERPTPD